MNEKHPLHWGDLVNQDDDYGVVFSIVHLADNKAWIKPNRITRLHDHNIIAGRCWCMNDILVSKNRLSHAKLDL